MCDGVPQCENGKDEQHCSKLASRVHIRTNVAIKSYIEGRGCVIIE